MWICLEIIVSSSVIKLSQNERRKTMIDGVWIWIMYKSLTLLRECHTALFISTNAQPVRRLPQCWGVYEAVVDYDERCSFRRWMAYLLADSRVRIRPYTKDTARLSRLNVWWMGERPDVGHQIPAHQRSKPKRKNAQRQRNWAAFPKGMLLLSIPQKMAGKGN